jgi:hypothetical protein
MPKKSNIPDTYGGIDDDDHYDNDQRYLDAFKDIDNNNNSSDRASTGDPSRISAPYKPPIPPKPIGLVPKLQITETVLDNSDSYLLPRHSSGISTTSNYSTSSTTPLTNSSSKGPNPLPRRLNNTSKNIYKPANINESDV